MAKHPKALTKAVNALGLIIAFNQEIGQAIQDVQNGSYFNDPVNALNRLKFKSLGIDNFGTVNPAQLSASITSKVGGYAFVKIAKFFTKRLRM